MHHPTCLISRSLIVRLGGFATGLPYSGDTEFMRRAGHAAKLRNVHQYLYYYRTHEASLTGAVETGNSSPARRALWEIQHARAHRNAERREAGAAPVLLPMAVAPTVELQHLAGPSLEAILRDRTVASQVRVIRTVDYPADRRLGKNAGDPAHLESDSPDEIAAASGSGFNRPLDNVPRPVLVIGPPRSGFTLLAACLAQHDQFHHMIDPVWVTQTALRLQRVWLDDAARGLTSDFATRGTYADGFLAEMGQAVSDVILGRTGPNRRLLDLDWEETGEGAPVVTPASFGDRFVAGTLADAATVHAWLSLFPELRVVILSRDPHAVVASLTDEAKGRELFRSHYRPALESGIFTSWLKAQRAGEMTLRALGSRQAFAVERDDLVNRPEPTLRRVLEFLDAPFMESCLRPLR